MKKIADFFAGLPWIALLLLVIFFDGLVGGAIHGSPAKKSAIFFIFEIPPLEKCFT